MGENCIKIDPSLLVHHSFQTSAGMCSLLLFQKMKEFLHFLNTFTPQPSQSVARIWDSDSLYLKLTRFLSLSKQQYCYRYVFITVSSLVAQHNQPHRRSTATKITYASSQVRNNQIPTVEILLQQLLQTPNTFQHFIYRQRQILRSDPAASAQLSSHSRFPLKINEEDKSSQ